MYGQLTPVSSLLSQNVGVSGKVTMLSEPIRNNSTNYTVDDADGVGVMGPYSLLSVHESIVETSSSSYHLTTITIGTRNHSEAENRKVISSSKSFILNAAEESVCRCLPEQQSTPAEGNHKPVMHNKQLQVELDYWPSGSKGYNKMCLLRHSERDSDGMSTPSSYSSAYTVTEHETVTSDASTNTDDRLWTSETDTRDHWSDESGSENKEPDGVNVSYIFINKNEKRSPLAKPLKLLDQNSNSLLLDSFLKPQYRQRIPSVESDTGSSNERSSLLSQLTCRDQCDKSEDEMWVANDCGLSETPLQRILPQIPILPDESSGSASGKSPRLNAASSVLSERIHYEDASKATRAPTCQANIVGFQCKGTSRQKSVEEKDFSELKRKQLKGLRDFSLSFNSLSRPTKRFSFLVRSQSLKDMSFRKGNEIAMNPGDKAIWDRISQLNLNKSSSTTTGATIYKVPSTTNGPMNTTPDSPTKPLCVRCCQPVYPQEAVRPTQDLLFHSSCFKCFHCGLRLTLGTFYKSSSSTTEFRIFCRSHLPTLYRQEGTREIVGCDRVGLRYF